MFSFAKIVTATVVAFYKPLHDLPESSLFVLLCEALAALIMYCRDFRNFLT